MKTSGVKTFLFSALMLCGSAAFAQIYFFAGLGLMNYNGDLQKPSFTFNQGRPALTLGSNIYVMDHFSVNASLTGGGIGANDAIGAWPRRNLNFKSNIIDFSLTAEADWNELRNYDPYSINSENAKINQFTPYVFAGVGFFHFNPYTQDSAGKKVFLQPLGTEGQGLPEYPDRQMYKLWQFNIPFGFGIKYAINQRTMLSAELGFRKTFTDYLDDASSHTYADTTILRLARGPQAAELSVRAYEIKNSNYEMNHEYRGNPDKKDNYYTVLIKLSYSFSQESLFNR